WNASINALENLGVVGHLMNYLWGYEQIYS
ncbi:MAG: hypothetical protein ACJA0I_001357, partial [Gammaproteobacteria bacterium]